MSIKARLQGGFTLVEAIAFLVVVSIGVVGILSVMDVTATSSVDPLRRKHAQAIAESLLEEVMLAKMTYCDPASPNWDSATSTANCATVGAVAEGWGAEAGNARPFDNVNDYGGINGATATSFNNGAGQLTNANGTVLEAGYTATVTIAPVALNGIAAGVGADSDVLQITITVAFGDQTLALTGYRTRYAPNDQ
jgi:MSHA pilin protein MshD